MQTQLRYGGWDAVYREESVKRNTPLLHREMDGLAARAARALDGGGAVLINC
eukprot:gene25286-48011_t